MSLCCAYGFDPFAWRDALYDDGISEALAVYPRQEFGLRSIGWEMARADPCFLLTCLEELADMAACDPPTMLWLRSRDMRRNRSVPVPHGWLSKELLYDVVMQVPFAVTLLPSRLLHLCSWCGSFRRQSCQTPFTAKDLVIHACDTGRESPSDGLKVLARRALETEILSDWLEREYEPESEAPEAGNRA